jgi:hypothetical protein
MGWSLEYDEAVDVQATSFASRPRHINVLAAAYMYGDMTPEPHHFESCHRGQFKAWALAAAFSRSTAD